MPARLAGAALAAYLRLVARTSRITGDVTRDQVVIAVWHEFNLASFAVAMARRRDLRHASFSTRGFRGTVITTLLRLSGAPVRVFPLPEESDRAASRDLALRLAASSAAGFSLVVTPDGPFGPYRVAKPGALMVARAAGIPVQPWAVSVRPAFRLGRRWDRQLVPLPFSRIRVHAGPRLAIAPRDRVGPRLAALQRALDEVAARADDRGTMQPPPGPAAESP
jgi:lysophospholipid acyltransferase (LPLAT)-like uncharacterized protein